MPKQVKWPLPQQGASITYDTMTKWLCQVPYIKTVRASKYLSHFEGNAEKALEDIRTGCFTLEEVLGKEDGKRVREVVTSSDFDEKDNWLLVFLVKHFSDKASVYNCTSITNAYCNGRPLTEDAILKDPYSMLYVDGGLDFKIIDDAYLKLYATSPTMLESPTRLAWWVYYLLKKDVQQTTFFYLEEMQQLFTANRIDAKVPEVDTGRVGQRWERSTSAVRGKTTYHLSYILHAERGIVDILDQVHSNHDPDEPITLLNHGFDADCWQRAALEGMQKKGVVLISGPAGSGKSQMSVVLNENSGTIFMAPTGIAVFNIKQRTNAQFVSTLHRYVYNQEYKDSVKESYVVVLCIDEMSMVEPIMLHRTLSQLAREKDIKTIVLVGDYDQLPPIFCGQVFKDLVHSKRYPFFKLNGNHRNGHHKVVADQLRAIVEEGKRPVPDDKVLFMNTISKQIEARADYDTSKEIDKIANVFFANTCKGIASHCLTEVNEVKELINNAINQKVTGLTFQKGDKVVIYVRRLNPVDVNHESENKKDRKYTYYNGTIKYWHDSKEGPEYTVVTSYGGGHEYRVLAYQMRPESYNIDDRVLCTKNLLYGYTIAQGDDGENDTGNVSPMNGMIGKVTSELHESRNTLGYNVEFEVRKHQFITSFVPKVNLDLGYCTTVHKVQGMEKDCILFVLTNTYMGNRNLLYTGMSRYKDKLYIFSTEDALKSNLRKKGENRRTTFRHFLQESLETSQESPKKRRCT